MIGQVKTWGNSQTDAIVLTKTFKHKTLEECAAEFSGKLGPYEEFEWGAPVGREQRLIE